MKKYFNQINIKPDKSTTSAFLMAISKTKTKANDLLIAQISFIGIILAFSGVLIAIFGI